MATHHVIVDCDPGVDDAIAILLAASDPEAIEIVGITTVAGNVGLDQATHNAGLILGLAHRDDVPLYAGCSRPIMAAQGVRSSVHGTGGLGDVSFSRPAVAPSPGHAIDFIVDAVMSAPGSITLCPIGPMTNVALAMLKEPRLAQNLKHIVFMGGSAFGPGNRSPAAEFNFLVDPHAAHIVMSSGAGLTMFGLDVTRKAVVTGERLDGVSAMGGEIARHAVAMLRAYSSGDPCLHDPCVIAHLLDPGIFSGVEGYVEVEYAPSASYGMSVASVLPKHLQGRATNCLIMTDLQQERMFLQLKRGLTNLQTAVNEAA